ncbi:MAG: O-antigen ligase family protein [Blastocatellales bacterium]
MNQVIERTLPANPSTALPLASTRELSSNTTVIILFVLSQAGLALLMRQSSAVATVHAWATLAVGAYFALSGVRLERVAYVAAYITGAEVLWRMTNAGAFWEFGKYAVSAIFLLALLRAGLLRGPIPAIIYFALMLPSLILPLININTGEMRDQISFNLSGPFALMVCVWFFSHLKLTLAQLRWLFVSLIAPTIGIAAISIFSTFTSKLAFSTESNFATSGGFGPNQVSAALGLGAMLAALYLMLRGVRKLSERALMIACVLVFSIQSALTLSRGGLYCAAGGLLLAAMYLIRDPRTRTKLILASVASFLLVNFIILPQLSDFTGGALVRRFQDVGMTGRDKIMMADMQTWADNPVFGVGPGQSKIYHKQFFRASAAHTEFSRMLAEHGIFGLIALVLMGVIFIRHLRQARTREAKALVSAVSIWGLLYMFTAAMRVVAPSFTFGLAALTLILPEEESAPPAEPVIQPYYRN